MPFINFPAREINCKLVYYGPGLGGKTANLQWIYDHTGQNQKGKMVSLATETDRTLFFDFLPVNAVVLQGFKTKFQLYTVPGQVIYNTTRQLVLRSVDGVVFVADSQWDKMQENVESFRNLEENLGRQHLKLDELPYALQYNKRDLSDVAPINYLEFLLNNRKRRARYFETVATTGFNVFAALDAVTQLLLHKFNREHPTLKPMPAAFPAE